MRMRWPDHYFCKFEKRFPQPEIKCTHLIHLEILFNLTLSSIFYRKPLFEQTLTHFLTLFYHIWLKTVSKGTWIEEVRKYQKKWINNIGEQIILIFINLENRWKRLHMLGKSSFLDLERSTMIHADHLCRWSNSEVFFDVWLSLEKSMG